MSSNTFIFKKQKRRTWLIQIGIILLLVIGVYGLVPQLDAFKDAFSVMGKASPAPLLFGSGLVVVAFCFAALQYLALSSKRLSFGKTLVVQYAGAFINRVIPSSIGAISLNIWYLSKKGYNTAGAGAVVAVNGIIGIVAHAILLLAIAVLASQQALAGSQISANGPLVILSLAGLLAAVAAYVYRRRLPLSVRQFVASLLKDFLAYRHRKRRLVLGILCSLSATTMYLICLMLVARNLGFEISLLQAMIAYSVGVFAATATPTPGGIGGAEAGLTAGLVGVGATTDTGLAITLLFRLLCYWTPMIFGVGAFALALRQNK